MKPSLSICVNRHDHHTARHFLLSNSSGNMSSRVKRHAAMLKVLAKAKPATSKALMKEADKDLVYCLCECSHNILKGNVPLTKAQKTKLTRYKQDLRAVARKTTTQKRKRQILQKGGFLPALLAPLLAPVIAPLASKLVGKIFR